MTTIVLKQNNTPTKAGHYLWASPTNGPHLIEVVQTVDGFYFLVNGFNVPVTLDKTIWWSDQLNITDSNE